MVPLQHTSESTEAKRKIASEGTEGFVIIIHLLVESASVYKLVITYACDEYIALLYTGEITRGSVTKCYEQSIIVRHEQRTKAIRSQF